LPIVLTFISVASVSPWCVSAVAKLGSFGATRSRVAVPWASSNPQSAIANPQSRASPRADWLRLTFPAHRSVTLGFRASDLGFPGPAGRLASFGTIPPPAAAPGLASGGLGSPSPNPPPPQADSTRGLNLRSKGSALLLMARCFMLPIIASTYIRSSIIIHSRVMRVKENPGTVSHGPQNATMAAVLAGIRFVMSRQIWYSGYTGT